MVRKQGWLLLLAVWLGMGLAWGPASAQAGSGGGGGEEAPGEGGGAWDPALESLGVFLYPASECASGCWRLESAVVEAAPSAEEAAVWGRLLDQSGAILAGEPWHVAWPDGNEALTSSGGAEWSRYPLTACYPPARGPGPYVAWAGDDPKHSDQVVGMGLPDCTPTSFRLVWRWQPAESAEGMLGRRGAPQRPAPPLRSDRPVRARAL